MALALPERISLFEVSPRDGLQNEPNVLPTAQKVQLIDRLARAGMRDIEVGSFVNPRRVPQVADTEEVLSRIARIPGARYWTLVPNRRGFERAQAAGAEHIAVFMSSSESHNRSNINRSISESLADLTEIIGEGVAAGMGVRAYVSTVFGCAYEGAVDVERVREISQVLLDAGAFQISLGDTIGVANPAQVERVMTSLKRTLPVDKLALHFHDTRGLGVANALVGMTTGVTTFDASLGGIGGCPFAPGATGNLATEDLLNMVTQMGIETGLKLDEVADVGIFLQELLERDLPSRYHQVHVGLRRRGRKASAQAS